MDGSQAENFHFTDAIRNLNFYRIAHPLAEQTFTDGRAGGDLAVRYIRLFAGDEAVG